MSEDWLVRGTVPLGLVEVVEACNTVSPELRLRGDHSETAIVIVDEHDVPVVWIGPSRQVGRGWVPWLPPGSEAVAESSWWTEITAPSQHRSGAGRPAPTLVGEIAAALAAVTAGSATRLSAAAIEKRSAARDERPAPAPRPAAEPRDPPADLLTAATAVLLQSRPVVALTPWLTDNFAWAQANSRTFAVVTPADTRLSFPAWSALNHRASTWIVDAGGSMYDGFTGESVEWNGERFAATGQPHPSFEPSRDDRRRVLLQAETTHPYAASTRIGDFSRAMLLAVGMGAPTWQGLLEPAETRFGIEGLTEYARALSPQPVRFVLEGPRWQAVCEVVPQPIGLVESVTIVAALEEGELVPPASVDRLLAEAATQRADSALLAAIRCGADGAMPPRRTGPALPIALHLSRRRFPTLADADAQHLAGPAAEVTDEVIRVRWPVLDDEPVTGEAESPAGHLLALLVGVQRHDSHRRAA